VQAWCLQACNGVESDSPYRRKLQNIPPCCLPHPSSLPACQSVCGPGGGVWEWCYLLLHYYPWREGCRSSPHCHLPLAC
jgi:hypothetical protein